MLCSGLDKSRCTKFKIGTITNAKSFTLHRHLLCFEISLFHSLCFIRPFILAASFSLRYSYVRLHINKHSSERAPKHGSTPHALTTVIPWNKTIIHTWTSRDVHLFDVFSLFPFHQDTENQHVLVTVKRQVMFRSIVLTISSFTFHILLELYCWMCVVWNLSLYAKNFTLVVVWIAFYFVEKYNAKPLSKLFNVNIQCQLICCQFDADISSIENRSENLFDFNRILKKKKKLVQFQDLCEK